MVSPSTPHRHSSKQHHRLPRINPARRLPRRPLEITQPVHSRLVEQPTLLRDRVRGQDHLSVDQRRESIGLGEVARFGDDVQSSAVLKVESSALGEGQLLRYSLQMAAQNSENLEHLARELAKLTVEDRAKVLANVARLNDPRAPAKLTVPKLSGGSAWTGGELTREQLYSDDGR